MNLVEKDLPVQDSRLTMHRKDPMENPVLMPKLSPWAVAHQCLVLAGLPSTHGNQWSWCKIRDNTVSWGQNQS